MIKSIQVNQQQVDHFILQIHANDLLGIQRYLAYYGAAITNRLHSQTRLPALYYAVTQSYLHNPKQQLQLINTLLQAGACLSFLDLYSNSYLYHACDDSKLHGLSPLHQNIFGQTIVFKLAKGNHTAIYQHLREKNIAIQIDHKDYMGRTPLFYAAEQGHFQICSLLIKDNAKCNISDYQNCPPAFYAKKKHKNNLGSFLDSVRKMELEDEEISQDQDQTQSNEGQTVKTQHYCLYLIDEDNHTRKLTISNVLQLINEHPYLADCLQDPTLLDSFEYQIPIRWQEKARQIVERCFKMPDSLHFRAAVDQEAYGITDYYSIVTCPMDLGTVRMKLTFNAYPDPQQFLSDMNLIFANCLLYNGASHPISLSGLRLKRYFQSICDFI